MYFDFGDGHPDLQRLPRALSTREEVLVAIIIHLLVIIVALVAPHLPWVKAYRAAEQARLAAVEQLRQQQRQQQQPFMFVQPRLDMPARKPPPQAPPSDIDRQAMTRFRPDRPTNRQPAARGNTAEFTEGAPPQPQMRAAGQPNQRADDPAQTTQASKDPGQDAVRIPDLSDKGPAFAREGSTVSRPAQRGALGDALRDLQRYADQAAFDNPHGGNGQFGPAIQFDTKGVEFGPWVRRFLTQLKRNWLPLIPNAAMSLRGHTAISFNVHRDGAITEITIVAPSEVDGFNNAAFNALAVTSPTLPLPEEYPSEKAFITVTFFYNETPPTYNGQ
jgi:TonB family protein